MFTRRNTILLGFTGLLVALGLLLGLLSLGAADGSQEPDTPIALPLPPEIEPEALVPVVARDRIQAIDRPQFETAEQAADGMSAGELVLGVAINGEARAYPIHILSFHEIVNDVVGGEPVAVTWCPLCFSAIVFSRSLEGSAEPLTFGVSGQLLNNTLVMYDRQTGSLWSQLYGGAVEGPWAGRSLAMFPSVLVAWEEWQRTYPEALVLSKSLTCEQFSCRAFDAAGLGGYGADPYASYYQNSEFGVVNAQIPRSPDAGGAKERVLGLRVGQHTRAYPFDALMQTPIVNDRLGDTPVVIWFDRQLQVGRAYERQQDGRTLVFRLAPDAPGVLVDEQTGTRWDGATGAAIDGSLRGQRLAALAAASSVAFGWFDHFPGSDLYTP